MFFKFGIYVGIRISFTERLPNPSWQVLLDPQANTFRLIVMAKLWLDPHDTYTIMLFFKGMSNLGCWILIFYLLSFLL